MSKKILIIDDEPDLLKVISLRLKKTGYEIYCGIDGQEALDLAREIMPDLIIIDVYLPIMNGDIVAKILKKDEKLKCIPIILISATAESLIERAEESGVDGCLTKPFEPEEMIYMIRKFLE